ncbi:MAG: hypothetical protein M1832_003640 [Thelocarpon impressellum]|nr:MAG: hypothetical protein M1832_003640 [Thelocarpon impressellum]
MFTPPRYTVPASGYGQQVPFSYASPMATPSPGPHYTQHYPVYASSSVPRNYAKGGHARRASHDAGGAYYAPPPEPAEPYFFSSPPRNAEYVSRHERVRSRRPSFRAPGDGHPGVWRSYPQAYDSSEEDLYRQFADQAREPLPRRQSYRHADQYRVYEEQVPVYGDAEPTVRRSRARRSSHSTRPSTSPKAAKPAKQPATKAAPRPTPRPPVATEEDRVRARIPAGYSLKNWDPTEAPVLLLGSVFDANSLGKWIYDWTVFHHGAATPMSEIAGELWLLLIQLSGKVKRAEECLRRVRRKDSQEMLDDFLESGERLWDRFRSLLKACERFMWKAARKETGGRSASVSMGRSSGCEFVDSIFGRDRELERTEKLMTGMRLWSMRFDANCEDILRRPTA